MKLVRWIACAAALVSVAACASYDPAKVQLSADSDNAVLLLEVDPVAGADSEFRMARYDEPNKTVLNNSFTGYANFPVVPGVRYVAQTVTPGTYAVTMVAQQIWWAACMHANSLAFDVKPGEVLYLGRLDPSPQLRYIQIQATSRGELVASQNHPYFYFDNVPALQIDFGPDRESKRTEVETYVKTKMQKVSAPVRLAEYRPAKFGNGYTLFGEHMCTGYFKEKLK